jgi:mono/diheme cytochrome c family protein
MPVTMTGARDRIAPALAALMTTLAGVTAFAQPPAASTSAPLVHQAEVAGATIAADRLQAGAEVFNVACVACHQSTGLGMPGAFLRSQIPTSC